ncbi:MAG: glycosyltransferase family 39 protein [Chloroflexi bacterium]|nr:glycosyltransferase family 39 protein [Chloroflexota bacterium]
MTDQNLTTTKPMPAAQDAIRTRIQFTDSGVLILLALTKLVIHALANNQYGWHRDELDMLDNARYLDWSYVAYPPVTPFITRVALTLFGPSLVGVRLFPSLAQAAAMVLAGLIARELGGKRLAQVVAAVAVGIAPIGLLAGSLLSYSSFDYVWWVLIAYLMIRLLKSGNPRWWLGIGAVIGLGLMTKYTLIFLVAGLVVGVLFTQARRYLLSPWLWGGIVLALLIFLPNLIWQAQHDFISLDFLSTIHARDVSIGRTKDFLKEQLIFSANVTTIPLWLAGLAYYFFARAGKAFRSIGWMFVVPGALLVFTQGRSYYLAAAYPMLLAAGAVVMENWVAALSIGRGRFIRASAFGAFAIGGAVFAAIALPIAPIKSAWWNTVVNLQGEFKEEIGWPELVETVANIYAALPAEERAQTGILTGNYGEAGAINLYGPAYGLPEAISGVNSYWLRGYGDPPPQNLILLDMRPTAAFEECQLVGHVTNRYGVPNEETSHPSIYYCRQMHQSWPNYWEDVRHFG